MTLCIIYGNRKTNRLRLLPYRCVGRDGHTWTTARRGDAMRRSISIRRGADCVVCSRERSRRDLGRGALSTRPRDRGRAFSTRVATSRARPSNCLRDFANSPRRAYTPTRHYVECVQILQMCMGSGWEQSALSFYRDTPSGLAERPDELLSRLVLASLLLIKSAHISYFLFIIVQRWYIINM